MYRPGKYLGMDIKLKNASVPVVRLGSFQPIARNIMTIQPKFTVFISNLSSNCKVASQAATQQFRYVRYWQNPFGLSYLPNTQPNLLTCSPRYFVKESIRTYPESGFCGCCCVRCTHQQPHTPLIFRIDTKLFPAFEYH
jgi:hypothetical protein